MGRIQSQIGLITGIPIADTVSQLMQLSARPRDLLAARNETLKSEQFAMTELSAMLLGLKISAGKLANDSFYEQRAVTSSNPDAVSARLVGQPPLGNFAFTPFRTVQTHRLLSTGVGSDTDRLGGGAVTFRFGDHLQRTTSLDRFGGGAGVVRGRIRIADRSGAVAEIDLSSAMNVDDVVDAVNSNTTISVTATTRGDRIRLTDNTGQTLSNLKVTEVGGGTTAASLGLAGIDVAADLADGEDVLYLTADSSIKGLNDGSGVNTDPILADIGYQLRDGTTGQLDLSPIIPGTSEVDRETALGEILDRINAAEPDKLKVEIGADGERLVVTDLTTGSGQFTMESINDSSALEDLGLEGDSSSGQIVGSRILGGLRTVLLSSLEGGSGLGDLGLLDLTDRSGATATVDLATAETTEDVIELINAAAVGIRAEVNDARTGIQLVDTTGASAGNLIVTSGDATDTAEKLHLAIDDDVTRATSGDLHLKVISSTTRLEDLNGGGGVARGRIKIVDSESGEAELSLKDDDIQTVGDVIREINRLGVKVQAELNETGDGIRIRDLADGSGKLTISDMNSTSAEDLHIAGTAKAIELDGQPVQVIDGPTTVTIDLASDDSLEDLRDKINELDAGLSASILVDGSSKPYRLSLVSSQPGRLGQLVVDTSGIGLSLHEASAGRDALLIFGDPALPQANVLIASSSNTFNDVVPGVSLQIHQASATPVTISVSKTDEDLVTVVEGLVDRYNELHAKLAELTKYDPETETRNILTGDTAAIRLDSDLSYLVSGRFNGAGSIKSLAEVGIDVNSDGTLQFDASQFKDKYESDPEAVREFFTHEEFGVSAKLQTMTKQLAEDESSLLGLRIQSLDQKIQRNDDKITFMNDRLVAEQERLLLHFYQLETTIAKLQNNLNALSAIQVLPPLTTANGRA